MDSIIPLKGVIQGKTIVLEDRTFLPDGHPVTLNLILSREEVLRYAVGAWADMTEEQIAEFERTLSELRGRPIRLPREPRS
jgi:hypothetical protein